MSMYGDYIGERLGDEYIENRYGFITYRFLNEDQCYIMDIYIKPDFRQTGEASKLADQVKEHAKNHGCKELLGTIQPSAKNSTLSLKALLGYGMQLKSAIQDGIVLSKEI